MLCVPACQALGEDAGPARESRHLPCISAPSSPDQFLGDIGVRVDQAPAHIGQRDQWADPSTWQSKTSVAYTHAVGNSRTACQRRLLHHPISLVPRSYHALLDSNGGINFLRDRRWSTGELRLQPSGQLGPANGPVYSHPRYRDIPAAARRCFTLSRSSFKKK